VKKRRYIPVAHIVSISLPEPAPEFGDAEFSHEALKKREQQGYEQAIRALDHEARDPCSILDNPDRIDRRG